MNKLARLGFGTAKLLLAALVGWGIFQGLPTRWWVVDGGATVVVSVLTASGLAQIFDHRHAPSIARVASAVVLAFGLAVVATLALTATWLQSVYGPVGRGGAAIFALVALLVLPYLVVLPALELVWLGPRDRDPASPQRKQR